MSLQTRLALIAASAIVAGAIAFAVPLPSALTAGRDGASAAHVAIPSAATNACACASAHGTGIA